MADVGHICIKVRCVVQGISQCGVAIRIIGWHSMCASFSRDSLGPEWPDEGICRLVTDRPLVLFCVLILVHALLTGVLATIVMLRILARALFDDPHAELPCFTFSLNHAGRAHAKRKTSRDNAWLADCGVQLPPSYRTAAF